MMALGSFRAETARELSYTGFPGRGTQVVRERSAKPLYVGSIPTRASIFPPHIFAWPALPGNFSTFADVEMATLIIVTPGVAFIPFPLGMKNRG